MTSDREVVEFFEKAMFMIKFPRNEELWSFRVWLGLDTRTHEAYAGTLETVARTWTMKTTFWPFKEVRVGPTRQAVPMTCQGQLPPLEAHEMARRERFRGVAGKRASCCGRGHHKRAKLHTKNQVDAAASE